ncbi:hypothetical protein JTE90_007635 [Oedothorax gibbosus]|uniref:Uncharacterized protein n=1 Tax=Oedothorax gibbosus TaxID=931172 RepID=A0AAV6TKV5_9ARAC|nr:hypothetical protein JTE90_007635 [Oedothorax gibbosus]
MVETGCPGEKIRGFRFPGEKGAWKKGKTTSKEGSRRANYPPPGTGRLYMGHSVCAPRVQLVDHSVCWVWPASLTSQLLCEGAGPRAVPLHRGNYFCGNMVHIVIVASGCGWV